MSEKLEILRELRDYFSERADAEYFSDRPEPVPNEEMRLLTLLDRLEAVEPVLARRQPCGCVTCACDSDEQCLGCGAKNCGTHPAGEIPSPVYESGQPLYDEQEHF